MRTLCVDPVQGSDSRDGLSPASAFRTVGKSKQTVSTLAANMTRDILPGYTTPNSATFTILSSTGTLSGLFANVPFGSRLSTAGYESSFIVSKVGNDIVLSAYLLSSLYHR